jgi:hypothetical protein
MLARGATTVFRRGPERCPRSLPAFLCTQQGVLTWQVQVLYRDSEGGPPASGYRGTEEARATL